LDDDLKWMIDELIARYTDSHEVIVFLAADHGMRYGEFESGQAAIQEHRLPVFFLLARHEFLQTIPYSYSTL